MNTQSAAVAVSDLFDAPRRFLWGLCYRMTGSAADADDVVQDTFIRALERPPRRQDEPWRPWLVRVAMNLARDLLRRRKRERYTGPWLPAPIETPPETAPPSYEPIVDGQSLEARYDLLESVSFAFLVALEALTPKQRAVLLLTDVFDYSVAEAGAALGMSASNVKTTHHRARRAMEAYDRRRQLPIASRQGPTRVALERFLTCLGNSDVPGIEAMLTDDARALTDGGGEFIAALRPIIGRQNVARFFIGVARNRARGIRMSVRLLNAMPALVLDFDDPMPGQAPRLVLAADIEGEERLSCFYLIAATRKLTAMPAVASVVG